jgi:hypothetical protein
VKIPTPLGVLVILLAIAGSARAGTIASGPAQGEDFICSAVNVGPSVIPRVTIEIVQSGDGALLQTDTCDAVEPDHECVSALFQDPVDVTRAFCRVTSPAATSHLRGNLLVVLGDAFFLDLR